MRRFIVSGALLLAVGLGMFGGATYRQSAIVHAEDACAIPGKKTTHNDGTMTCDCTVKMGTDCECLVPAPKGGCTLIE